MRLKLDFHIPTPGPVDAAALCLGTLLRLKPGEIERLPIGYGNKTVPLGEICKVEAFASQPEGLSVGGETVHLHRLGMGMEGGCLEVDGDAGPWAGVAMRGGQLVIHGNAGDSLGAGMQAGLIRVLGDAGDRAGAALLGQKNGMSGGTILVSGKIGCEAAGRMRRGLVVAGKDCGSQAGVGMHAGTLLAFGSLGPAAGLNMNRGSLVANGCQAQLPGFRPACLGKFLWLDLLLNHLKELNFDFPAAWKDGLFWRYTGNYTGPGKGEILLYAGIE